MTNTEGEGLDVARLRLVLELLQENDVNRMPRHLDLVQCALGLVATLSASAIRKNITMANEYLATFASLGKEIRLYANRPLSETYDQCNRAIGTRDESSCFLLSEENRLRLIRLAERYHTDAEIIGATFSKRTNIPLLVDEQEDMEGALDRVIESSGVLPDFRDWESSRNGRALVLPYDIENRLAEFFNCVISLARCIEFEETRVRRISRPREPAMKLIDFKLHVHGIVCKAKGLLP